MQKFEIILFLNSIFLQEFLEIFKNFQQVDITKINQLIASPVAIPRNNLVKLIENRPKCLNLLVGSQFFKKHQMVTYLNKMILYKSAIRFSKLKRKISFTKTKLFRINEESNEK
ncbi:unnamed protein product [Brachionus calyciflorus]|uniref:Uncharacterized protein n=1 Tax=Brachionus calyciflorus TaxID=104777 RepID=A0A813QFI3_9BILA|nr:unnamed protein product [Brachionus calyciflorus]